MSDSGATSPVEGSHVYKFGVNMSCGGCSGAVKRVLQKLDGIENFDVSLDTQSATITTKPEANLSYDEVLQVIAKTGKKVISGVADGEEKSVEIVKAE